MAAIRFSFEECFLHATEKRFSKLKKCIVSASLRAYILRLFRCTILINICHLNPTVTTLHNDNALIIFVDNILGIHLLQTNNENALNTPAPFQKLQWATGFYSDAFNTSIKKCVLQFYSLSLTNRLRIFSIFMFYLPTR